MLTPTIVPAALPVSFPEWERLQREFLAKPQPHEADFNAFRQWTRPAVFIDVGANIGNSAASIRATAPHFTVHSFEPNPGLWPLLEGARAHYPASWELHRFGLSRTTAEMTLHVPVVDGTHIIGEASLLYDEYLRPEVQNRLVSYGNSGKFSLKTLPIHLRRFDDLGMSCDIIKIDVEGAEIMVLEGMQRTIAEQRPVFLIENSHPAVIDALLAAAGYSPFFWDPRVAALRRGSNGGGVSFNSFYLPAERHHIPLKVQA